MTKHIHNTNLLLIFVSINSLEQYHNVGVIEMQLVCNFKLQIQRQCLDDF